MDSKHETKLAAVVAAELRKLPERQAPADLAAAVLRRVRADERATELLHAKLRALPDRAAPAGLIPAVLQSLQSLAGRPWWTRPWTAWPLWTQWVGLMCSLGCVGLLVFGLQSMPVASWTEALSANLTAGWRAIEPFAQAGVVLLEAMVRVVNHVGWLGWSLTAGMFLAMYTASLGLGTMCLRVAAGARRP